MYLSRNQVLEALWIVRGPIRLMDLGKFLSDFELKYANYNSFMNALYGKLKTMKEKGFVHKVGYYYMVTPEGFNHLKMLYLENEMYKDREVKDLVEELQ